MTSSTSMIHHFGNVVYKLLEVNFEGKVVIDFGSGYGRWGHFVRSCVSEGGDKAYILGCDIFLPYLKNVKKFNPYDDLCQCDVRFPPFRDESADIAFAFEVIEHMTKEEAYQFLDALKKICKQLVVISTPIGKWLQDCWDGNVFQKHRSVWSPQDLRKLGFRTHEFSSSVLLQRTGLIKLAILLESVLEHLFGREILDLLLLAYFDKRERR